MPTRYLKPGIRDSGHIEMLSNSPEAECLYYRLLVTVDDFGRFDARPLVVKGQCFPLRMRATADKCMQWLKELEDARLISLYVVDGKEFLQISKWDNKPRAEQSKFPAPPVVADTCMQLYTDAPLTVTDIPKPKPIKTTTKKPFELPDWIPEPQWNAWIEARLKVKKPATDWAKRLAVAKLEELKEQGHHPAAVLAQSAFHNWPGLYQIKQEQRR